MIHEPTLHDRELLATPCASERKPYVAPVVDSLGGALSTLLASGCVDINCTICVSGNPGNGNDQN